MIENIKNKENSRYWTVEEIRPYVINELKKRFPNSIIMREFDSVDIMVLGPKVPVEIQRTYESIKGSPMVAQFEDRTERQIRANIENCGICWLFVDVSLLYYLQNDLARHASIDMKWMYQFWKDKKLRIFTITTDGIVREMLEDKEFDFIKKSEEQIMLERNKYDIAYKALRSREFTTDEISNWYNEFEEDQKRPKRLAFSRWLVEKGGRRKELGDIKRSLNNITLINEMLKCDKSRIGNEKSHSNAMSYSSVLRIIEGNENNKGGQCKHVRIRCSDIYNILEYFPGYLEMKELWDYWRTCTVSHDTFVKVVKGEYPNYLKDYKNQKNIDDSWGL